MWGVFVEITYSSLSLCWHSTMTGRINIISTLDPTSSCCYWNPLSYCLHACQTHTRISGTIPAYTVAKEFQEYITKTSLIPFQHAYSCLLGLKKQKSSLHNQARGLIEYAVNARIHCSPLNKYSIFELVLVSVERKRECYLLYRWEQIRYSVAPFGWSQFPWKVIW